MSALFPFKALRPSPESAARVASVPYDVVNTEEARALATGNPLSFLHVTRSEIDLPADTNPYDARVYAQAVHSFEALKRDAPLLIEEAPALYVYRLRMGRHEQTGLAGCFSLDEYDRGLIKKHEHTRRDKEDDRTRHVTELRAQTGVVFLTYRAVPAVDRVMAEAMRGKPLYDFVAPDGISHTVWRTTAAQTSAFERAFGTIPALYIADGHHRAASASRARAAIRSGGGRTADADRFVAVAFADSAVQILPYNRAVKDLAGSTPASFLASLRERMTIRPGQPTPSRQGEVSMFLDGAWQTLSLPRAAAGASHADGLDVAVLDREVLGPLLKIGDVRTDKRIDFIGGARGTAELERLVASGRAAVAFSMFPVSIGDLMAIADAGGIMPPKSTWFEPKLRDGLLVHLI
jgi:uncharacterized protein (DUF1015 family)